MREKTETRSLNTRTDRQLITAAQSSDGTATEEVTAKSKDGKETKQKTVWHLISRLRALTRRLNPLSRYDYAFFTRLPRTLLLGEQKQVKASK